MDFKLRMHQEDKAANCTGATSIVSDADEDDEEDEEDEDDADNEVDIDDEEEEPPDIGEGSSDDEDLPTLRRFGERRDELSASVSSLLRLLLSDCSLRAATSRLSTIASAAAAAAAAAKMLLWLDSLRCLANENKSSSSSVRSSSTCLSSSLSFFGNSNRHVGHVLLF
jgi:hypothetical protein